MTREQRMVAHFHQVIGAHSADRPTIPPVAVGELRKKLISEELLEFCDAIDDNDIVGVADALGDLLVVVYGAGVACGIDLGPVFEEIHRTNMLKAGGPIRADGKRLKPEGWRPPELEPILRRQEIEAHQREAYAQIPLDTAPIFENDEPMPPYLESRDGC